MNKSSDPYGEKLSADKKGGRLQPNSGRGVFSKGDFIVESLLFDRKETINDSYSISLRYWRDLQRHAYRVNLDPALEICFKRGNEDSNTTLIVISESSYNEFLEIQRNNQKIQNQSDELSVDRRRDNNSKGNKIKSLFNAFKSKKS